MKFGIDMDGCLVNFNEAYARKFIERGYPMPSYSDGVEQPPTWNYPEDAFGVPDNVVADVWTEIAADPKFWIRLRPLPECGVEFFAWLRKLEHEGHELHFITSRSGVKVHAQTVHWLYINGLDHPQVIVATKRGKAGLAYEMGLDVVIEDHPGTLVEYAGARQVRKNAPVPYRIIRPYNEKLAGHQFMCHVKTVREAIEHALTMKEVAA